MKESKAERMANMALDLSLNLADTLADVADHQETEDEKLRGEINRNMVMFQMTYPELFQDRMLKSIESLFAAPKSRIIRSINKERAAMRRSYNRILTNISLIVWGQEVMELRNLRIQIIRERLKAANKKVLAFDIELSLNMLIHLALQKVIKNLNIRELSPEDETDSEMAHGMILDHILSDLND